MSRGPLTPAECDELLHSLSLSWSGLATYQDAMDLAGHLARALQRAGEPASAARINSWIAKRGGTELEDRQAQPVRA